MSVQALKKGAINFLQKPVDERQLIAVSWKKHSMKAVILLHTVR